MVLLVTHSCRDGRTGENVEQEQALNRYVLVTACSLLSIKGKGLYRSVIMPNRFVNRNAVKKKKKKT